jgi:hypothetical protein
MANLVAAGRWICYASVSAQRLARLTTATAPLSSTAWSHPYVSLRPRLFSYRTSQNWKQAERHQQQVLKLEEDMMYCQPRTLIPGEISGTGNGEFGRDAWTVYYIHQD